MRSSFVMNQQSCQARRTLSTTMLEPRSSMRETRRVQKMLRRIMGLGILAGATYAVWRAVAARKPTPGAGWQAQPFPFPPQPAADATSPWIEPAESGGCPAHHPVKAKLASGIFHVPGGANYTRTQPDRCYLSGAAAEADGLRPAKR